jgi:glycosyltransferase involved in cell wall biosynthesis
MRIALLNQFFWPDTVATSQLLTDVARDLNKEHQVIAICGRKSAGEDDCEPDPEVTIVRVRGFSFGRSGVARLASYLSFLLGTAWQSLTMSSPDVYVTLTTPPLLSPIGSVAAKFRHARHVIWEMDVYPDIATDIGYFKKDGIVDRLSGMVIDWARRRADAIIVLGEDMKARLVARGIPISKIHVAENWADGAGITPRPFAEGPLVIHYSGNLGLAHETLTITNVISRLRNHPSFQFIFSGGGPKRSTLEGFCRSEGIQNVDFRPCCSRADLGASLAGGHLGLVTQAPVTLGSVVPSKIYGIMAAGRPLLYIGPDASTPARHIESFGCGWRIDPVDVDGAVQLLHRLDANRDLLRDAGGRARAAFEEHFNRPIGVARVIAVVRGTSVNTIHSHPTFTR